MMNRLTTSLIFLLMLLNIGQCQAGSGKSSPLSTPLLQCAGIACIDVVVEGGRHLRMVVDTGDATPTIDSLAAARLGLAVEPAQGPGGVIVPQRGIAVLRGAMIGSTDLGEIRVVVKDLATRMGKGQFPLADGYLTPSVFFHRTLELNYRRHSVTVSGIEHTVVPCPSVCAPLEFIPFAGQGTPVLIATGLELGSKPITAQIDTLFTGSLLIYPQAMQRLGLVVQKGQEPSYNAQFTDNGVHLYPGDSRGLQLHDVVLARQVQLNYPGPEVSLPQGLIDATLGTKLLQDANLDLWMNFESMEYSFIDK